MQLGDSGRLSLEVSDVADYRKCPWGWLRQLDVDLSGGYPPPPLDDPIRALMAQTATSHRARVERFLVDTIPHITRPAQSDGRVELTHSPAFTGALRPEWSWSDPTRALDITARADAVVPGKPGWRVLSASLGHSNIQKKEFAAYGATQGLETLGFEVDWRWDVVTAHGEYLTRSLSEVHDSWIDTLDALTTDVERYRAGELPLGWWETPADQCGRLSCAWCTDALSTHEDVFHTARLRRNQRRVLKAHGIHTMAQLVSHSPDELIERIPEIEPETLRDVHRQATLQVASHTPEFPGLAVEVINRARLASVPDSTRHDLYLDFEGDPSYQEWPPHSRFEPGIGGPSSWLGIDYLIGVMHSGTEEYDSWWAESFAAEGEQFRSFIDALETRLRDHPEMKIYHYAGYELTALQRLAARHDYGSALVSSLVERDVLVDLYREVMACVAIGSPSYSLKKLEPLYFEGVERSGITGGAESVVAFSDYLAHRTDQASEMKEAIIDYNRVDCLSTKRLHRWLLKLREGDY